MNKYVLLQPDTLFWAFNLIAGSHVHKGFKGELAKDNAFFLQHWIVTMRMLPAWLVCCGFVVANWWVKLMIWAQLNQHSAFFVDGIRDGEP